MSETEVTVLGVTIVAKLCFSQHISVCCKKADSHLNALARISKHLTINSCRAIYNSIIMSNFNCCPLVGYFCGHVNNKKLEKIHERFLKLLFAGYNFSYMELLERADTITVLIQWRRLIGLTVFTSWHGLNPPCLNYMFAPKCHIRCVNRVYLNNPVVEPQHVGSTHFLYIGAKLWSDCPMIRKMTYEYRKTYCAYHCFMT